MNGRRGAWCRTLAALAFVGAPAAVRAQATLPERHDTMTVLVGDSAIGRSITTWRSRGGTFLQVREWHGATDGARVTDSLLSDRSTLEPIREVQVRGDSAVTVIFGRDTVFVTRTTAGGSSTAWAAAPAEVLYSSASVALLAAAMPFSPGATRSILTLDAQASTHGVRRTTIRVEGEAAVRGRPAWRVTADTPGGGSAFWIDAETRTVLQMDVREGGVTARFRR